MRELVKQALRMRPDRLVVGEARGGEVVDLLAALNTGHEGGCGTIHANTAHDVPARVEALATAGGLDRDAAHSQLAAAIEAIVELDRRVDGTRYLRTVSTLERAPNGYVIVSTAWAVSSDGAVSCGPGIDRWHGPHWAPPLMFAAAAAAIAAYLLFPASSRSVSKTTLTASGRDVLRRVRERTPAFAREQRDREVSHVTDLIMALSAELRAGQPPVVAWAAAMGSIVLCHGWRLAGGAGGSRHSYCAARCCP